MKVHKYRFNLKGEEADSLLDDLSLLFTIQSGEPRPVKRLYLDSFDWRLFRSNLVLWEEQKSDERRLRAERFDGSYSFISDPVTSAPRFASDVQDDPRTDMVRGLIRRRTLHVYHEENAVRSEVLELHDSSGPFAEIIVEKDIVLTDPLTKNATTVAASVLIDPVAGLTESLKRLLSFFEARGISPVSPPFPVSVQNLGRVPGENPSGIKIPLDPAMPSGTAIRRVLRALFKVMTVNEPGLRARADIEFLHNYRVAVRRSRTILGQMKAALPPYQIDHFQKEFKWLNEFTGTARDLDVYLHHIESRSEWIPEALFDDLHPLYTYLLARRESIHHTLLEQLDSERYHQFKEYWKTFISTPAQTHVSALELEPILATASAKILKVYRRILKLGSAIHNESPDSDLHFLRIQCKKLRYMIEAFYSMYPEKQAGRLIRELKTLQDNLGKHQDCAVQKQMLKAFAHEMVDEGQIFVDTLLAMGRLSAGLEDRQDQARSAFKQCFSGFAQPENRHLFEKLLDKRS